MISEVAGGRPGPETRPSGPAGPLSQSQIRSRTTSASCAAPAAGSNTESRLRLAGPSSGGGAPLTAGARSASPEEDPGSVRAGSSVTPPPSELLTIQAGPIPLARTTVLRSFRCEAGVDPRGNFSVSAQFVGDDRGAPVGHTGMDQDDTRSPLAPALADQGPSTVRHRQPLAAPLDRVRDAGSRDRRDHPGHLFPGHRDHATNRDRGDRGGSGPGVKAHPVHSSLLSFIRVGSTARQVLASEGRVDVKNWCRGAGSNRRHRVFQMPPGVPPASVSDRLELTTVRPRPPLTTASRWRCGQNCGQKPSAGAAEPREGGSRPVLWP